MQHWNGDADYVVSSLMPVSGLRRAFYKPLLTALCTNHDGYIMVGTFICTLTRPYVPRKLCSGIVYVFLLKSICNTTMHV